MITTSYPAQAPQSQPLNIQIHPYNSTTDHGHPQQIESIMEQNEMEANYYDGEGGHWRRPGLEPTSQVTTNDGQQYE